MGGAYELYILSKTSEGNQGFIHVDESEAKMITDLSETTKFFREELKNDLINDGSEVYFLISMIPFIRGMASITGDNDVYNALSKVMHGTQKEFVDVSACYKKVFNCSDSSPLIKGCKLNSEKIISLCSDRDWIEHILRPDKYKLLDRTLRHTMAYLYLRIWAEEVICRKFDIKPDQDNKYMLFGKILSRMAEEGEKKYPEDGKEIKKMKIQMMAMKTLVNEFNHFEGNLSIFQPAIDISDEILYQERTSIEKILFRIEGLK